MAASPPQIANFIKDVVALKKRVRELELSALRKTASTLKIKVADLVNAKVFGATNHQVFTYMDGDWIAAGGPTVKGYATDSGTGDLSVSVDLVDGDWDTTRACRVEATMLIDPAYVPIGAELTATVDLDSDPGHVIVFPDTAGVAWVPAPVATLQLIDADAGPGAPSADAEVATRSWSLADPHLVGGGDSGGTVSWTFTGGTPHIEANIAGVDTDAWPESHAIYVIWRLSPLP
jgi:hypothetical protein